jgi:hypothetical protein
MQPSPPTSISQRIITRYFSNSWIFLVIALVLGGLVRWQVIAGREFPLNDGGYWYVFTKALVENHFALPEFVQFNGRALPTYYPPLAGYLLALISSLGNIDILSLLLWVPFFLCLSMILVFYTFTLRLFEDQLIPRFAILFFALSIIEEYFSINFSVVSFQSLQS